MQSNWGGGRAVAVLCVLVCLAGCSRKPGLQIEDARKALAAKDADTALVVLKNVLQGNPELGEARLLMANALFLKDDWAGSAAELEKAGQLGVSPERLVVPRARVLLAQGKARQVIEDFEDERLNLADDQADLQVLMASALYHQRQPDRAEQALSEALRINPKHLEARLLRARVLVGKGRDADLAGMLDAIVQDHPTSADAHLLRYKLRVESGAPAEERLAALQAARKADPKHASSHAALVEHHIREKQYEKARSQLSQFARKHPRDLRVRLLDATLTLREGNPRAALEMARELIKIAPRLPAAATLAGVISFQTGDLLQAESSLAKVLSEQPDNTAVRVLLARSQLGQGDADKALATVRGRIGGREPQAELLAVAGAAYMMRGDFEKAEQALSASLRAGNNGKAVRMSLALLKLEGNQAESGFAELNQLVAEETEGHTAQLALVNAHLRTGRDDEAARAIDTLSQRDARSPMGPFLRGQLELKRSATPSAREAFSEALRRDPRHLPSISALNALDLGQAKGTAESRKRLQRVLDADPRNVKARLALIRLESYDTRDADRARSQYAALIKDAPTNVEAHMAHVRFHMDVGDFKQALTAAQAAAAALPGEPQVFSALGRAQILIGDLNQALSTYGQWASAQPRSITPLLRIAEVQMQRKDYGAASAALARALAIQPNHAEAQQAQISLELQRGRFEAALTIARRIQNWPANRAVGAVLEGDVHAAQKQWPAALRLYQRALSLDGDSSGIATKVHQMLTLMGNRAEADRHVANWLERNPKSLEFHLYVGSSAFELGDLQKAEFHFERALELAPDQALVANNLAWLRIQLKRSNALEMALLASRLQPRNAKVLDTLASAYALSGDVNAAVKSQREALDIAPKDDALRFHMVELLLTGKRTAEAKAEAGKLSAGQLTEADRARLRALQDQLQ